MCPRIACLLGALALIACKTTPLDVVYADVVADSGVDADADAAAGGAAAGGAGGAAAGGATSDGGSCSMVGPGQYVLRWRANGNCLGQGAPTMVFGNPGFMLDLSTTCRDLAHTWQFSATATPNVYTIENLAPPPGFVLDVQMAGTRDGTPVITYGKTMFDNQRFEVRARDEFGSELRPQHHPQSCVSASADSAQITTCDASDPSQAWLITRSSCL